MTEIIQPNKIKIGGLWKNQTKTGTVFYNGDLSHFTRVEVWPNKKREGMKDPDFNIFVVEKIKKVAESAVPNDFEVPAKVEEVPF